MKVTELLMDIEKLPELHIGSRNIYHLRHYLCGYISALHEYSPTDVDWDFDSFTNYLAEKYNGNRSIDWAVLIACYEPEASSTDSFFRLLHEYGEHKKKLAEFSKQER